MVNLPRVMNLSFTLTTLAHYLAGEFDNRSQALAEPAWYVHLRLWLRPVKHLWTDSYALFAEQANIVNLSQPYRPRLLRLRANPDLCVEHYAFKDITKFCGGGTQPELLQKLTSDDLIFLPDCTLLVSCDSLDSTRYRFRAMPKAGQVCSFEYQFVTYQVSLGFEVEEKELQTYDKGLDSQTKKAIWGAILGPYRFQKLQQFTF